MDTTTGEIPNTQGSASLFAKMVRVMGKMDRLKKTGYNSGQKYQFATDADVADLVREAMVEERIAFFASMTSYEQSEFITSNNAKMTRTIATFMFTFCCPDTGATESRTWIGESLDNGDKGINKASTAAEKFFLLKTFIISTGDKADEPDYHSPELQKAATPKQTNGKQPTPPSAPVQPTPSQNGTDSTSSKTITWPSTDAINTVLTHIQRATGVFDMTVTELARLVGVENADDLDAWKNIQSGQVAYDKALAAFEAEQPKAQPADAEYHATVTEASYHRNGSDAYLEFRAPGMPRTYGRTTKFREMVGDAYYDANGFEAMENVDRVDKPQTIAPLELWWEYKISHNPDGSVKSDYMLITNAKPVTKELKPQRKIS
jgi:ERF superfamily protein